MSIDAAAVPPPPEQGLAHPTAEMAVGVTVGMIPIVGGPAAAVIQRLMAVPHEHRMQTWFEQVAAAINELAEREQLTPEQLFEDDRFTDAVFQASRIATVSHQKEKLESLRHGLLHSIGDDAPTVDEQARFFRFVDELTPTHMLILRHLDDPVASFTRDGRQPTEYMAGARSAVLEDAFPDLFRDQRDWYELLVADLVAAHLVSSGLGGVVTGRGMYDPLTTLLGRRFLAFVTGSGRE